VFSLSSGERAGVRAGFKPLIPMELTRLRVFRTRLLPRLHPQWRRGLGRGGAPETSAVPRTPFSQPPDYHAMGRPRFMGSKPGSPADTAALNFRDPLKKVSPSPRSHCQPTALSHSVCPRPWPIALVPSSLCRPLEPSKRGGKYIRRTVIKTLGPEPAFEIFFRFSPCSEFFAEMRKKGGAPFPARRFVSPFNSAWPPPGRRSARAA